MDKEDLVHVYIEILLSPAVDKLGRGGEGRMNCESSIDIYPLSAKIDNVDLKRSYNLEVESYVLFGSHS